MKTPKRKTNKMSYREMISFAEDECERQEQLETALRMDHSGSNEMKKELAKLKKEKMEMVK